MSDGGPAFPAREGQAFERGQTISPGMTLRDWFAGMALTNAYTQAEDNRDKAAAWAYELADALLKARQGDE